MQQTFRKPNPTYKKCEGNCYKSKKLVDLCIRQENQIKHLKVQLEHQKSLTVDSQKELLDFKADIINKLRAIFSEDQLSALLTDKQKHRWSQDTYTKCLKILYSCGNSGYNFLRLELKWPIPSRRSIIRNIQCFKLKEGINNEIITFLNIKLSEMKSLETSSGILFDEISISPGVKYDTSTESYVGGNDLKKAVVFLVRGISTKWKIPVSFHYTGWLISLNF